MKKWGILFLILISIIFLNYNNDVYGISPIEKTFKLTGAEFMVLNVEGKGIIKTSDKPFEIVKKIFDFTKESKEYTIKQEKDFAELSYLKEDYDIKIIARKIEDENKVYVCFELSQYEGIMNINNIRRTINSAFSIYEIKPSFCTFIQGKYNENMTNEKMKEKALKAIVESGSRLIDNIEDRSLVSFYGYNPYLKDRVLVNSEPININVALRYSATEGCTYIWIGNPVINAEY
ncbi:TATA-box binding [Caloramator quimbayensis]|uniref:TATA-box binding n=1 Tax=Caloramator quimbayensis TaxID=1147123 RepID=A0A1T4WGN8_9CLOT|nr:YwmB family TATA-box binding protein [Caloramator quimbayensis]SKA75801.1 TATA-box binding [Caloramator quimbayensis]